MRRKRNRLREMKRSRYTVKEEEEWSRKRVEEREERIG